MRGAVVVGATPKGVVVGKRGTVVVVGGAVVGTGTVVGVVVVVVGKGS